MNIKSLLLSALVITGSVGAAHAAPSTCAYREGRGRVTEFTCDVHTRVNANGHKITDVAVHHNGEVGRSSFLLWKDADGIPSYAEVFHEGTRETASWFIAENGAIGVTDDRNRTFYFH